MAISEKSHLVTLVADPKELFVVHDCEDIECHDFIKKVNIEYWQVPENWATLGGTPESIVTPTTYIGNQGGIFWYRLMYDPQTARY